MKSIVKPRQKIIGYDFFIRRQEGGTITRKNPAPYAFNVRSMSDIHDIKSCFCYKELIRG
jgi:hypothetical protein